MAATHYNNTARSLHWLVLVLLVIQFAVAWTMPDIHRDTKPVGLIAWHLSIGIVILLVMLVRQGWRAVSVVPPTADLPPSLRLLSRMTHFLLYANSDRPAAAWLDQCECARMDGVVSRCSSAAQQFSF
jgi:cytochrome b561